MFDAPHLKLNDKLIDESSKLVEEHNRLSYESVAFNNPSISFNTIKPKNVKITDKPSQEIIQFYETYTQQMIISAKLGSIIDSINYTNEDLAIHIDRSSDAIVQIFSSLTEVRHKLRDINDQVKSNISKDVALFVEYMNTLMSSHDVGAVVKTIFICMKQNGLLEKLGEAAKDRYFIYVGIKLIEMLYKNSLLSATERQLILDLNRELKQDVLGVGSEIKETVKMNYLQTFGIVPDEGTNTSLHDVIQKLFGIEVELKGSIKTVLPHLTKALKLANRESGQNIGLIVMASPNEDTYFNMSNLDSVSSSNPSAGINDNMIKNFELIEHGSNSSVSSSEILTIGIDQDTTDSAFVLWTNDLMTFKVRSAPIDNSLIKRICRNVPSAIIEEFNRTLETFIVDNRKSDVVAFNMVKYMSFNDSTTEESFLTKFQSKLTSAIMSSIGKSSGVKLHAAVIDPKFTQKLLQTMDASKIDLGIHPQLLSAHCHIIYASMANKILHKLKKELLSQHTIDTASLKEIIKAIVESNDNIYSRVIASYYLHIA